MMTSGSPYYKFRFDDTDMGENHAENSADDGAAGGVGQALRPLLSQIAEAVVLSDITSINDLRPNERFVACDLADRGGVEALVTGVDGIIHLGGISLEKPFDLILQGNIVGLYNLYEAARAAGKPRIVFASSNHTIGYYRRDERIDSAVPTRPDPLYGVSKVYGEALASLYFDKFGQETLSVRIGSCFPEPRNPRMLATWFSARDLMTLCSRAFETLGSDTRSFTASRIMTNNGGTTATPASLVGSHRTAPRPGARKCWRPPRRKTRMTRLSSFRAVVLPQPAIRKTEG